MKDLLVLGFIGFVVYTLFTSWSDDTTLESVDAETASVRQSYDITTPQQGMSAEETVLKSTDAQHEPDEAHASTTDNSDEIEEMSSARLMAKDLVNMWAQPLSECKQKDTCEDVVRDAYLEQVMRDAQRGL